MGIRPRRLKKSALFQLEALPSSVNICFTVLYSGGQKVSGEPAYDYYLPISLVTGKSQLILLNDILVALDVHTMSILLFLWYYCASGKLDWFLVHPGC